MRKIAITGIIGAGKSTVGLILQNMKMDFISADVLARKAIAPQKPGYIKLLDLLGSQYLNDQGYFDTQKIAEKAFQNQALLYQIESIIHPVTQDLMQKAEEKLLSAGKTVVFYELPLLFEKKKEYFFDTKVVIAIDSKKQKNRLQKYRNLKLKDIENRMKFQMSQSEKIKGADYVIWNNLSLDHLKKQVFSLVNWLKIKNDFSS